MENAQLFSFSSWKMCYFILASMISEKDPLSLKLFFLFGKVAFLSHYFQDYLFLSLVFWCLIIMGHGVDFFWYSLFEILSASWICVFPNFCQIWEVVSYHFFWVLFQTLPPSPFWDSDDMNARSFVIISWVPEKFCSFFLL